MIWTDIYLKFFVNTLNREFIRIEFSIFFLIVNQYLSMIFNLSFLKKLLILTIIRSGKKGKIKVKQFEVHNLPEKY